MKIFLKNLEGETVAFDVEPFDSVEQLKEKITEAEDIPASEQRLIFAGKLIFVYSTNFKCVSGKQLEDGFTLENYCVQKGSTLHLSLRLLAGVEPDKMVIRTYF
jgi:ubiquitin C